MVYLVSRISNLQDRLIACRSDIQSQAETLSYEYSKIIMTDELRPSLTVDAVIEFPDDRIVLIRRANPPFEGQWALPGGFVDWSETVAHACIREAKEETSVDIELVRILGVYSDPSRDPRRHTVSVVFIAKYKSGELKGSDDAREARLFSREELREIQTAFDHDLILKDAGWKYGFPSNLKLSG